MVIQGKGRFTKHGLPGGGDTACSVTGFLNVFLMKTSMLCFGKLYFLLVVWVMLE